MILLSVDPGTKKNNVGWAWFGPAAIALGGGGTHPQLLACGLGHWSEVPVGGPGVTLVIELPQIYPKIRSKGDPNDMMKLMYVAARIAGRGAAAGSVVPEFEDMPKPRDWKGTVDKEIMLRRILKALSPEERAVEQFVKCAATLRGNMIDAIGIGSWWLREHGMRP